MKQKDLKNLANFVKKTGKYKPDEPPKKPKKQPSKEELEQVFKLDLDDMKIE
jgi:hypothetical protein